MQDSTSSMVVFQGPSKYRYGPRTYGGKQGFCLEMPNSNYNSGVIGKKNNHDYF